MASNTNGLNKITDKILAEAKANAERITASAKADCDRIRADYAARAEEIRRANEREAEQKAADLIARAKSSAAMEGRDLVGQKRSELIEQAFQRAFGEVEARSQKEYTDLVVGLLAAALCELSETEEKNLALYGEEDGSAALPYEVVLNRKDRSAIGSAVVEQTRKRLKGKLTEARLQKLVLAQDTAEINGGVILRYGDVESNCSLEMIFSQLRRELETDVSRTLFAADETV